MKQHKKLESLKINSDLFDSINISAINGGAWIEPISTSMQKNGGVITIKDGFKVGDSVYVWY